MNVKKQCKIIYHRNKALSVLDPSNLGPDLSALVALFLLSLLPEANFNLLTETQSDATTFYTTTFCSTTVQ